LTWGIEAYGLTKIFPRQNAGWRSWFQPDLSQPAVAGIDLQVAKGELFGLLGRNGAGKTTLIKMLSTLIIPTAGSALVNGYTLEQDQSIKASIGLVTSDERSFYWRLTGRQNLIFFAHLHHIPAQQIEERVEQVLKSVNLLPIADKRFMTYSSGMRQRLSIARALLNQPKLLFLDEPTRGLDPQATINLHELIRTELHEGQGVTIFLTTHDLQEAESLCDRIAIMEGGRIRACGTVSELRAALNFGERYQIQVRGMPPSLDEKLHREFPALSIKPTRKSSPGNQDSVLKINQREIEIVFRGKNSGLNEILDTLRESRVEIITIHHERASLASIFTQLIEPTSGDQIPGVLPEASPPRTESKNSADSMPVHIPQPQPLRLALAFLRRDFLQEASYRIAFLLQFANIFFSVAVFYFISQLLGDSVSEFLRPYGGNYFSFVLIGIALSSYFGVGLSSFSNRLRQAQTTGTLEAMLATPTPASTIILSSSIWDYLITTIRVIIYLLIGLLFIGIEIKFENLMTALFILVLSVISFSSIGILAASFIMVLKRGDPITWIFNALSSFLGGVYYPVAVLPGWLQPLAALLPITYSLEAMRLTLLQGVPLTELAPQITALVIFSLILLPLSLWAFRFAVRRTKIEGSLTQY